jgi:hypothetical protein
MAPTRETMARALALEAGEYFDGLAEAEKDLKSAQLVAAADQAASARLRDGAVRQLSFWN